MISFNHLPLQLGRIVVTNPAMEALAEADFSPHSLLERHVHGDWGDLSVDDAAANDQAAFAGYRVMSFYELPTGKALWIVTEADRAQTTVLLG